LDTIALAVAAFSVYVLTDLTVSACYSFLFFCEKHHK